jgi:predicted transcriptional regulator of viral defense system
MREKEFINALISNNIRVFTLNDAVKIIRKPSGYVSLFLSKLDSIKRIERNKYYVRGTDPAEIASNIIHPSYISLVYALAYYKSITQMPVQIDVIALKQHKPLEIEGFKVRFIKVQRKRFFGYINDNNIFIAEPEKAIIDCLLFNVDFFYISESFGKLKDNLDIAKLKQYAIAVENKALINRLGFLLERHGINAEDLLKYRSRAYVPLSKNAKIKDKRWRVIYAD